MVVAQTLELVLRQGIAQESEDLHVIELYIRFIHRWLLLLRRLRSTLDW